ncbi:MAG: HAMP domain-containing protein, partial [Chloroflexaceae bacterium]|nr:HAMP domain-containing protein [Chloroflexaceae bacterium]
MSKLNLGTRLFLSHLFVMLLAVGSFAFIAKVSARPLFVLRLEQLAQQGNYTIRSGRTYLIQNFEIAWNRSAFWSAIAGTTAAGALSYWASQRILQPLERIQEVIQKFAAGDLQERVPASAIPELNQLALSFNRMASSLEGVEQRRRQLIGDMTHELRTPLTVVRGYLEELAEGRIEPSGELYLRLVQETRRLERLTNDLQELSKAEAGYLSIDLRPLNLRPLLISLVERFADQVWEEGPQLRLNCPAHLPAVLADRDRTEQILVNLLGNALRYTQSGEI